MPILRDEPDLTKFNKNVVLPFEAIRLKDFELAMQDIYDFFFDVNLLLTSKGLERLDICCDQRSCQGCSPTCSAQVWQGIHEPWCKINFSTATLIWWYAVYIRMTPSRPALKEWKSKLRGKAAEPWTLMALATNGCVCSSTSAITELSRQ